MASPPLSWPPALAALLLTASAWAQSASAPARLEQHASPQGFTISYPDAWRLASSAERDRLADRVGFATSAPSGQSPSLILVSRHADRAEHAVCALVVPEKIPMMISDEGLSRQFRQAMQRRSIELRDVRVSRPPIGGRKAIAMEWLAVRDGSAGHRQKVVLCPVIGGTLIVSCSAPEEEFAASRADFDTILSNLGLQSGGDEGGRRSFSMLMAVAGLVMLWLVLMQSSRRRARAAKAEGGSSPADKP